MGVLKARVGGAWVPVSQGFDLASAGYVGHAYASAAVTNQNGTADVPGCSVTWTADPTHRYKTTFVVGSLQLLAVNGQGYAIIANAANGQLRSAVADAAAAQNLAFNVELIETGLSGTQTRKGRLSATSANWTSNGTAEYGPMILVEDITAVTPQGLSVPWSAFVPTFTQPGAITKTVNSATYMQIGKLVIAQASLNVTGAGTGNQQVKVGLPVPARAANALQGIGQLYDASTAIRYVCFMVGASTTELWFAIDGASTDLWGISPNLALANGDAIQYNIAYEAA